MNGKDDAKPKKKGGPAVTNRPAKVVPPVLENTGILNEKTTADLEIHVKFLNENTTVDLTLRDFL